MPGALIRTGPVAIIAAFAVSRGIPFERITEVTGLTLTELVRPEQSLPDHLAGALWRLLHETFPQQAIGLEMAAMAPFEFFGPLTHVASHAESLRQVLHALVRYRRIVASDLHLAVIEGPRETELVMHHPLDAGAVGTAPEAVLGLTRRFIGEVLGLHDVLVRLEFAHARGAPAADYAQFFGVEVRFDQPRNAMVLRSAALDEPTRQGDAHRFVHLTAHLDLLHRELVEDDAPGLASVRAAIAHNARRGEFGVPALARHMGLSPRTLQRKVRAEDSTVRQLIEQARARHAERLLQDATLSTDEVAFLLGYSTASAFRRAFRRWTGQSPAQRRADQRRRQTGDEDAG